MNVIFSADQISNRVHELAAQISRDYGDEVVHTVGILESGFVFLADLIRKLACPVVCHFITKDARDTVIGTQSMRDIVYGPIGAVEGNNILLVDALVDSGITLDHLVQQLLLKKPKSVRTAALVNREDRRRLPLQLDYAGFSWQGNHLVGYGLDQNGRYRNLPYVAAVGAGEQPGDAVLGERKKGGAVTQ